MLGVKTKVFADNEYILNLNGLKILDLTHKKYNILNWIALLLQYRIPAGLSYNDELVREYWYLQRLRRRIMNFSASLPNVRLRNATLPM